MPADAVLIVNKSANVARNLGFRMNFNEFLSFLFMVYRQGVHLGYQGGDAPDGSDAKAVGHRVVLLY